MSITPLAFTGVSKFSEDFQTILQRATRIASLPAQALQNQAADLIQQKLLVSNLSGSVGGLADAVKKLGTISKDKALGAISSNTSKVTATNVASSAPALYNITDITSIAKAAGETSAAGYATSTSTPVSSTGIVKVISGSNEYTVDISGDNSLAGLRNVINSLGAGITASVLTTGTGANPYYLSVTANSPGATTLQIRDDPTGANTNLLTSLNQGANTEFKINGAAVSKKTTFINDVVPGVTFQILGTTTASETVSVNVTSDRSKLAGALSEFVSNYNAVREQVNGQVGESAGLLSGDFLVRQVQSELRNLTNYNGTGGIKALADVGIVLNSEGVASFDRFVFDNLTSSQVQSAFDFFGSPTTGFGALSANLSQISDSVTGLAKVQLDNYAAAERRINEQIAAITDRVTLMQRSLSEKLQIADTLLAQLQSQQSVLDASIQSLSFTAFGKQA